MLITRPNQNCTHQSSFHPSFLLSSSFLPFFPPFFTLFLFFLLPLFSHSHSLFSSSSSLRPFSPSPAILCASLLWACCKNRALPVTPKVVLTVWIIGVAFPQSQRVTVRIWFTVCNSIAGMSRAFVSYDTIRRQRSYGTLWQQWKTIINSCRQQGTSNHWSTFNTC